MMLRRRLTVTVVVLLVVALLVTVGATIGAVQDWRQDLERDGIDVVTAEEQLLQRIAAATGGTAFVALLLAGAAAWVIVGRELRGITDLVTVARDFGDGGLSRRMPVRRHRTEAATLAVAFNGMADNLQTELERRQLAEEELRRFLADASHELRTPVATVRGYAELLRRTGLDDREQVATAMARIESESARIGELVEGMLALAGSGRSETRRHEPVTLRSVAATAVDAARVRDPERRWLLADGPEHQVPGDPDGLRRLIDNLLANATAHTPPGTTATIRIGGDASWVDLSVTDDGPGLPTSMSDDPFGRFVRGPAESEQTPRRGSGLGLAIVRAIAEAHGGSAELLPHDAAAGLTVQVRLPVAGV